MIPKTNTRKKRHLQMNKKRRKKEKRKKHVVWLSERLHIEGRLNEGPRFQQKHRDEKRSQTKQALFVSDDSKGGLPTRRDSGPARYACASYRQTWFRLRVRVFSYTVWCAIVAGESCSESSDFLGSATVAGTVRDSVCRSNAIQSRHTNPPSSPKCRPSRIWELGRH